MVEFQSGKVSKISKRRRTPAQITYEYELALKDHPMTGDPARWEESGWEVHRVCNICGKPIAGSGFDTNAIRPKRSVTAEKKHILHHMRE